MQFITAILPVGYKSLSAGERLLNFLQLFMAIPLVFLFYGVYKWKYKTVIKNPRMSTDAHAGCEICAVDFEKTFRLPGAMLSCVNQCCPFVDLDPPPNPEYYEHISNPSRDTRRGGEGEEANEAVSIVVAAAEENTTYSEFYRLSIVEVAVRDRYRAARDFFRFPWV